MIQLSKAHQIIKGGRKMIYYNNVSKPKFQQPLSSFFIEIIVERLCQGCSPQIICGPKIFLKQSCGPNLMHLYAKYLIHNSQLKLMILNLI